MDEITLSTDALRRIESAEAEATRQLRDLLRLHTAKNPDFRPTPVNIEEGGRRVIEYVVEYAGILFDAQAAEYANQIRSLDDRRAMLEARVMRYVRQKAWSSWMDWFVGAFVKFNVPSEISPTMAVSNLQRMKIRFHTIKASPELTTVINALRVRFPGRLEQRLSERLANWTTNDTRQSRWSLYEDGVCENRLPHRGSGMDEAHGDSDN